MGVAPHFKLATPQHPYSRDRRQGSKLRRLILCQEWQKVLIRVRMYPNELRRPMILELEHNVSLKVWPLHLVCALDPPARVVQLFLDHYVAAASISMEPSVHWKIRLKTFWERIQLWVVTKRQNSHRYSEQDGGFPTLSFAEDDMRQLLPKADELKLCFSIYSEGSVQVNCDEATREQPLDHSTILQLSPCRGEQLPPSPSSQTGSDHSITECQRKFFRVTWDLNPLLSEIKACPSLTPLHVACLYQASSKVIQLLIDASPASALSDVVGMLPIHLVAAGWTLPVLVKPKRSVITLANHGGPLETLAILKKAIPETVRVRSGFHGMTPDQYVQQCMEEGVYMDTCLHVLTDPLAALDTTDGHVSVSTHGSSMFVDSSDGSNCVFRPLQSNGTMTVSVSSLIEQCDWQGVLECVEDYPTVASQWIYGIGETSSGQSVWKRLPIHLACYNSAPFCVVAALLQAYPPGVETFDPPTKSLPLQIACAAGAALPVIRILFDLYPDAVSSPNVEGRVAVHSAVLSGASFDIIEALVAQDPRSVMVVDQYDETPYSYATQLYGDAHVITELLSKPPWFEQVDVEWTET